MTTQSRPTSPRQRKQSLIMFLIFAVGFIAFPTYFTGVELGYRLFGVTTAAQLIGHHAESRSAGKHGGRRTVYVIEYSFRESGGQPRRESHVLAEDLAANSSGQVTVEYIPGLTGYSRIQGRPTHWFLSLMIAVPGALCGWIAWLIWKGKDATPSLTKPAPAKSNPDAPKKTPTVQYGWLIFAVIGVVLLGASLLPAFREYAWVAWASVIGVGVMLFFMEREGLAAQKRTHALQYTLQNLARELNLKFNPEGHEELHESLKRFHLATLGPYSIMKNLMYGQRDGTDVALFEYSYQAGKSFRSQTVIWMQRRGTRMTEFSLRPESVWNQLVGWTGHGDINFDSHPQFSHDYLLRGDDEEAIRELFTDEVLKFYETHPELITEGEGNKLLYYRDGQVLPPERIPAFLMEALEIRSLFNQYPDRR